MTTGLNTNKKQFSPSAKDARIFFFWYSIGVIIVFITIFFLMYGNVLPASSPYHEAPLAWYEYTEMVLFSMLPSALFGLTALSWIKASKSIVNFFGVSTTIGAFSQIAAYYFYVISHADCGNDCVQYVPTYGAVTVLLIVGVMATVAVPLAFAFYGRWLDRK